MKKKKKWGININIITICFFSLALLSCKQSKSTDVNDNEYKILSIVDSNNPIEKGMSIFSDSVVIGNVKEINLNSNGDIELILYLNQKPPDSSYYFCYKYGITKNYILIKRGIKSDTLKKCDSDISDKNQQESLNELSKWLKKIDSLKTKE